MVARWVPAALALIACQGPAPDVAATAAAARDATFAAEAAAGAAPRVLDDVAAELLRAAALAIAVEQRVRCENIANVDTPGYKRRVVRRASTQIVGDDGQGFTTPVVTETGARRVFTTGTLEITERGLDVAIDGEGFFAVSLPDGAIGYTRDGCLGLDADGRLVTGQGDVVVPEITVPSDTLEISIDPTGRVTGRTAGSPDTATTFGQLTLSRFVDPCGLRAEGHLVRPTDESGAPITGRPGLHGLGLLRQGFVERSNVDLGRELLALQLLEQRRDALRRVMRRYGLELP